MVARYVFRIYDGKTQVVFRLTYITVVGDLSRGSELVPRQVFWLISISLQNFLLKFLHI